MEGLSLDLVNLLTHLMPGFLAAWVLYGLTSYPKPSQFERVIQALIFSFLVQALVPIEKFFLMKIGALISFGSWNDDAQLVCSAFTGLVFGLIASYYANNDKFYRWARSKNLTKRTAYPSEWYGAFTQKVTYVVLHLKGNRRIMGWPSQWPSEPTSGHFELILAAWLEDDNGLIELGSNESILILASDVEMVEFTKQTMEICDGTETAKS